MADYPTSFDKEALLACARGELFGPGNAQLPAPPMLMMDISPPNSTSRLTCGFSNVISRATRSCPAASVSTGCGS